MKELRKTIECVKRARFPGFWGSSALEEDVTKEQKVIKVTRHFSPSICICREAPEKSLSTLPFASFINVTSVGHDRTPAYHKGTDH